MEGPFRQCYQCKRTDQTKALHPADEVRIYKCGKHSGFARLEPDEPYIEVPLCREHAARITGPYTEGVDRDDPNR